MDEVKKYDYKGTVTISTDEYRDMLNDVYEAKKEFNQASTNYWSERQKRYDAEKELETAKKELDVVKEYKEFISSSDATKTAYKLFIAEKKLSEQELN